jgi:hypothetical protein
MWWMKDLYLYEIRIGERADGVSFQILPERTDDR